MQILLSKYIKRTFDLSTRKALNNSTFATSASITQIKNKDPF